MITKRHLLPRAAFVYRLDRGGCVMERLAAGHDAVSAYPTKPLRLILAFTPGWVS
jgi:hypothetical protein